MSAADRMAVRTPDGRIRSVPRRVGLGMVARNQAKAAPHQRVQPAGVKGNRPASAVTIVTAEAPELVRVPVDVTPVRVVIESVAPDGTAETIVDADSGPMVGAGVTDLPIEAPAIETPKGNASRDVWAKYADARGVTVTDEMGRNEIRAAVAELALDRMSRPAFADHSVDGGRPATPEDEPVTEDMVTSADPGERTA
jgi:hypothetical protein